MTHRLSHILAFSLLVASSAPTPVRAAVFGTCEEAGSEQIGATAEIFVGPCSVDFGAVAKGAFESVEITVVNRGASAAPFGGISIEGPAAYDVVEHDCTLPDGTTGVGGGASCRIRLGFAPDQLAAEGRAAEAMLHILRPRSASTTCGQGSACLATIRLRGSQQ